MANQKSKARKFNQMSYHQIQRANSKNRSKLHKEDQKWLKDNSYRNIGWNNIINLYQKLEEFLDRYQLKDLTLEELFLEADQIGNKYLTSQEIAEFNRKLSQEVNEIAQEFDQQFPDTKIEVIDFKGNNNKWRKQGNLKSYKTIKL